jgi:UDP-N-acetylmuramyl pentapeptide phosphotransferase/UDP-N-acetylglucosamine-1-phosphate transferase
VLSLFSLVWRNEVSEQGVRLLWVSAMFAYPLLIIGFIDDAIHLGARTKFLVYAALSTAAAWTAGVVQMVPVGGQVLYLPYAVGLFGTALWMFTLINVVNFMDGANGLAMGSVAVGLLALAAIALERGSPAGSALALCGAGALIGFLVWNFPHGRLFAGDSGALFAGAIAAFGSLIVISRTGLSPFVPPILFFPLLADALLTLLYRMRRGRSLLVGHAEHLYQLAIAAGFSHARISLIYWGALALCGVIACAASRDETGAAPMYALAALAGLSLATDMLARRRALAHGVLRA